MILVDTLEKRWHHVQVGFMLGGVEYEMHRLATGDYIKKEDGFTIIDRKHGLEELVGNLMPELKKKDGKRTHIHRDRFIDEIMRAKISHARFIVLIEGSGCESPADVAKVGKMPHSQYTGAWLAEQMFRLEVAYGVEWMFCKPCDTWKVICKELGEPYYE